MTIDAWLGWGLISVLILVAAIAICVEAYNTSTKVIAVVVASEPVVEVVFLALYGDGAV